MYAHLQLVVDIGVVGQQRCSCFAPQVLTYGGMVVLGEGEADMEIAPIESCSHACLFVSWWGVGKWVTNRGWRCKEAALS